MITAIERISEEHIAGFHACLDAVAREQMHLGQTQAPPLERVAEFVRANIQGNLPQYVALHGGRIVGWCDAIPHWAGALSHRAGLGMGVLAAYRGKGIGTRLLSRTLEHARSIGVKRVDLEVRADNTAAIALYTSAGFKLEGRKSMGLFLGGQYHDTIEMGLIIEASAA
ncbi:GNAT family N-acetyltransferase [Trinickia fusca]|uniref:GNAT family N-acetyltransferase n=1 Tax=Trinickia fusca TaxID=2419777 RepID=UPI0016005A16|nr:GNAT family N-acetyltransferase [Trinickia fusca]